MTDKRIATGLEELDRDLERLFELERSGKLEEVQEALEGRQLDERDLLSIVPEEILRLTLHLLQPFQYSLILDNCREEARPFLEEARRIVDTRLAGLLKQPGVVGLSRRMLRGGEKQMPGGIELNVVEHIVPLPIQIPKEGSPLKLVPAFRIWFLGKDEKVLLDCTLNWDQILFVVYGLLKPLVFDMERWQDQATRSQIDLGTLRDRISGRIGEIHRFMERVMDLAPAYDIEPEGNSSAMET